MSILAESVPTRAEPTTTITVTLPAELVKSIDHVASQLADYHGRDSSRDEALTNILSSWSHEGVCYWAPLRSEEE